MGDIADIEPDMADGTTHIKSWVNDFVFLQVGMALETVHLPCTDSPAKQHQKKKQQKCHACLSHTSTPVHIKFMSGLFYNIPVK
jgi:hypothetical protein